MEDKYPKAIAVEANGVFDIMDKRVSAEDMLRIRAAFELAYTAHDGQKRKSGEPYIIHPIAVARIVAEGFELGANPVIAAFLHDVVEDTKYTIEDIEKRFGTDVRFLVETVTKKPDKTSLSDSKQVDNYRQILWSLNFDIRALLLKLADRLHNMRTLDSMKPAKQMKIAGETDYFYAPLANRLGLYHVKSELEDLSFRYRCPREYNVIDNLLKDEQKRNAGTINNFVSKINNILKLSNIPARTEVVYRKPYSVWRKMKNKNCDFAHTDGKYYIRIIYLALINDEKAMSLNIYSALTSYFKVLPRSINNYIDSPKTNGYQSFHIKLVSECGSIEEIHISSERMVRNSRLGCAAKRTEANIQNWIDDFKKVLNNISTHSSSTDYMGGIETQFYNDDINVFTSEGSEISLPKNATALDYAFEVNKDMGKHAVYARINGKLMSVTTVLHRGDCVEIGYDPDSLPDEEWENHVSMFNASEFFKTYQPKHKTLSHTRCCQCHPLPGDEVIGFKDTKGKITIHKRNCKTAIRLASQHGDSITEVDFKQEDDIFYPVRIRVRGIDRYHLMRDLLDCITEEQKLPIARLTTENIDRIAQCTIDFSVKSADQLENAIDSISKIDGIDEVIRLDLDK